MPPFTRHWLCVWFVAIAGLGLQASASLAAAPNDPPDQPSPKADQRPTDPLLAQVHEAIDITTRRYLSAEVHTPWQIMHGLLALRDSYQIKQNGKKGSALDWVAGGATYRGDHWFEKTRYGGRAHPYSQAYAFEGHPNQMLAILAMCEVPLDRELKAANNQTITVRDIVQHAQKEVATGEEITWTLWALSHYLPPGARWESKWGETWSVERLVRMQIREQVTSAACGGTHGLFALSYALNAYIQTKQPLRGIWLAAAKPRLCEA